MTGPGTGRSGGATAIGDRQRRRRPLWLWLLLALVIIVILVLVLVRCTGSGGNDPQSAGGAAPSTTAPPAAASPTAGAPAGDGQSGAGQNGAGQTGTGQSGGSGTLTADGTPLLPVAQAAGPNGELSGLVGRAVTAQRVAVQSVPADEGFWVGTSDTDRVWVQLTTQPGESPYRVAVGDRVDFTGSVVAQDAGFAQQVGVDAAEGADQLTRQAAHLEVAKADLRKSPA
ncbi:hypothetical protein [Pseudonocardia yuanmonensis]|uniref:hypothetical protein n=1 Tax=Pseudonocardia yuanmonensis TaxID=1095914 RepID=UPI0031E71B18